MILILTQSPEMFCNICLIVATIIARIVIFVNYYITIFDLTGVNLLRICRNGVDKMGKTYVIMVL